MPSLSQYRATTGRRPISYPEDLVRAQTGRLVGMRERELDRQFNERRLALTERDQDIQASAINQATAIQGLGTAVQGAGLLETVRPGTISNLFSSGAPAATTPGVAAPATATAASPLSTSAIASAVPGATAGTLAGSTALPGGSGISAAYPLFGGASPAALPAAATPAASGAATAAGLSGAAAPSTVASTVGSTTGVAAGLTAGAALGVGGVGLAAGALGSKLIGPLLPFGGKRTKGAIGGAVTGAGAGALAGTYVFPGVGTAVGAVVGAIGGAIGGAISIIATATYGIGAPETLLAQAYRRKFMGQTTYLGYRILFDPLAQYLEAHPESLPQVKRVLVEPCLRAMAAELCGLPEHMYAWERGYLDMWLRLSREAGRQMRQAA